MRPPQLGIAEDEQLVVLDGPAEAAAEHVLNEHGLGDSALVAEEIVGVQVGVADVLEYAAVVRVGARAGDQFHLAAGVAAVFRLAALGDHAELFHRVGIVGGHGQAQARRHGIVDVDAVEGVVIAALPHSVDVRVAVVRARVGAVLRDRHAGLEIGEGDGLAGQLRQVVDFGHGHGRGNLRVGGSHRHHVGGHFHRLPSSWPTSNVTSWETLADTASSIPVTMDLENPAASTLSE